jgi:hypothetical protein
MALIYRALRRTGLIGYIIILKSFDAAEHSVLRWTLRDGNDRRRGCIGAAGENATCSLAVRGKIRHSNCR